MLAVADIVRPTTAQAIADLAALGVGASKLQSILHHVLPLAAPGILTGVIIGLAQALGESDAERCDGAAERSHRRRSGRASGGRRRADG